MSGVKNQQRVQSFRHHRIDGVIFARNCKHHVEKILTVAKAVLRIIRWLTNRFFVRIGCKRTNLRNQANDVLIVFVFNPG